ncbi:MAG: 5'/3'-nucleotidase SurE [Bacteroidia bacterium]|nr:MAG: 5'/3'-nucleotidase SurE [Bacteroidia bacterium]
MTEKPYILITNDDGISIHGLRLLIETARQFGEVLVVAPDAPQSAQSHSITQSLPLKYRLIKEEKDYAEYSCGGTPVDCVKLALHQLGKRKPDLLLSGVNHGDNTAISVLYSGTMAAAIEGTLNGIKSIGFSVANHNPYIEFLSAKSWMEKIIVEALQKDFPTGVCLNVNFPDLTTTKVKGIKTVRAANAIWQEQFVSAQDPHGRKFLWMTGYLDNKEPEAEDTDLYNVERDYATVVPVKISFDCPEAVAEFSKWDFNR